MVSRICKFSRPFNIAVNSTDKIPYSLAPILMGKKFNQKYSLLGSEKYKGEKSNREGEWSTTRERMFEILGRTTT